MSTRRFGFRRLLPLLAALTLVLPLLLVFATPVSAQSTHYVDSAGGCGGSLPCHTTITAAVAVANPNDTIYVYPGNYPESVNFNVINGNIVFTTPGPTTVNPASGKAFHCWGPYPGNVTIDGFTVVSADSDGIDLDLAGTAVIRNVIANGSLSNGIVVRYAGGNVQVTNCVANHNDGFGVNIGSGGVGGNVTISNCTANQNDFPATNFGIWVGNVAGYVSINNCIANDNDHDGIRVEGPAVAPSTAHVGQAPGDVAITDTTASRNGNDGIEVYRAHGNVRMSNCTAIGNDSAGIQARFTQGDVTIGGCVVRGNSGNGVLFEWDIDPTETHSMNGSIVCGNAPHGLQLLSDSAAVDATGNWWGCAAGPGNAGCDSVNTSGGAVNATQRIGTVVASASVDPVAAGNPTEVKFQFSDTSVYLGEGPGDLHGVLPFTVSTDNGILNGIGPTIQAGINNPNGVLAVTLVPDTSGTATVTLDGPCGIGALDGTTIDVDVLEPAPKEEFVPEPGSLLLLASGLTGLAGYAGLRLRRR